MKFAGTPDPRRHPGGYVPDRLPSGLSRGVMPPHIVQDDHVAGRGLDLAGVSFDRASFAFNLTQVSDYFVNSTAWKRVGNVAGQDAQAYIGPTDEELYVWVWATFGWANADASGDHAQFTAVLYNNDVTHERASNIASNWLPNSGNFYEMVYQGFFKVPVVEGAEWSVGMQQRLAAASKIHQSVNRQSITAFVSGVPDDASSNTEAAVAGDTE